VSVVVAHQAQLYERVGDALKPLGFRRQKAKSQFWRDTAGGGEAFHLAFRPYSDAYLVAPSAGVRIDSVETIATAHSPLTAKEKASTFTVGANLGTMETGRFLDYPVPIPGPIDDVVRNLLDDFRRVAQPFFEAAKDSQQLLAWLSDDAGSGSKYAVVPTERCIRLIIAATQFANPEKARSLAVRNERYLLDRPNTDVERYRRVARDLGLL
jgi:hypothetical protein